VDRGFRNLFPLYPAAFKSFGVLDHDVVVSSSSGWAHSIQTSPHTLHAVYCHAPARWLYGGEHIGGARRQALSPFLSAIRHWDRTAARRADLYIVNSREVRRRVRRVYGIDAPVIYPPVETARFTPHPRGERLLVVSRLLPYKRVETVIDAATHAGLGLDVVGTGPSLADLQRRAGPTVEFHGRLEDQGVTELMEGCRALCLPGKEDFGITAVEANAAGKPVIAFAAGGALETIVDGLNGVFFNHQDTDDLLAAIDRCDRLETTPQALAGVAERFSYGEFEARLLDILHAGLRAKRSLRLA
jgi:glycosyltransferase involved in cell wall biosynthesis